MSQFKIKINIFLPLWILFILVEFVQSLEVNTNHLMCLEESEKCEDLFNNAGLPNGCKRDILRLVNQIRVDAISGELKFFDYATLEDRLSTGIGKLRWDTTLEETAQAKANQCAFERSDPSILKIDDFEIGEIIGWRDILTLVDDNSTFIQTIKDFEDEAWKFDVKLHFVDARDSIVQGNLEDDSKYFGNIVELLKDEYYLIGCGVSKIIDELKILHVCHLGPQKPGNLKPLWSEKSCKKIFDSNSKPLSNGLCITTAMSDAATLLQLETESLKDTIICKEIPTTSTGSEEILTTSTGSEEILTTSTGSEEILTTSTGSEEILTTSTGSEEILTTSTGSEEILTTSTDSEEILTTSTGSEEILTTSTGIEEILTTSTVSQEILTTSSQETSSTPATGSSREAGGYCTLHLFVIGTGLIFYIAMLCPEELFLIHTMFL